MSETGFESRLAGRLSRIPDVVAVALGGSRAVGTHRPDSDWDFGLYFRGSIDPDDVRALGYPGTVVAPGEWAYPMNGGAWLTVEGRKVDLLYRDLDDVERWIDASREGRWELYRVPGYLAGMPSYALVGEVARGRVLAGTLPRPDFPDRLRERAPARWRWEAGFALEHAEVHRRAGDAAAGVGKAAFALLALAHARLAESGRWALNEKGMVRGAGLEAEETALFRSGNPAGLGHSIASLREVLARDAGERGESSGP